MWFRTLLESIGLFLEREAGQHFISMTLIVTGILIADPSTRMQFARDLVVFGLGVLSRSMGATKSAEKTGDS